MARVKIYSYKACDTCRRALKFLDKAGVEAEVIDITATPPSKKELEDLLDVTAGELKRLFNTSGVVYREEKVGDQLRAGMTKAAALKLLGANGKLVKRPVLVIGGKAVAVGFDADAWGELLP